MNKTINVKRALASGTVASILMSAVSAVPVMAVGQTSISGAGRIETAINIAETSWLNAWKGSTNAVVIGAADANLVDGLAVAPLAYNKKAPILLNSEKDSITPATMAELVKNGVKTVYLATGTGVVSDKAKAELEAKGITVKRLGGANRYETSKNVATELGTTTSVAVVNGAVGIADAMSIASIAASQGMQIALASDANTLSVDTTGKKVYAIGGTGVLSDALVTRIGATRLAGNSAVETNAAVVEGFKSTLKFDKTYLAPVADGNLVDSLTGSVLAAQTQSPIMLTGAALTASQSKALTDNLTKDSEIITFGGAVNPGVVTAAQKIVTDKGILKPLAVDTVTALNATQVSVAFTQAVDKTDAETVARYSINGVNPATAVLGTDGKTVTLTFAAAASVEVTDQILVVEAVKSVADATVTSPRYTKIFTYLDEVKPTIVSVESKTNGSVATSVTVKVSEPVASSLAKIDGLYYTINFGGTDTATITGLTLDKATSHTLELINLTDKATTPNVTVSAFNTFSIVTDTVAPTATLSQKTDKTILVTFSKSMDVASVQAALTVKDEAFAAVATGVPTVVPNTTDNKQFTVAITPALYTNAASRTLSVVLPNTIKDSIGNAMATTTQQITLTKDVTAPVATGYKVIKDATGKVTDLEINFSEELIANANPAEPVIVDSNGVVVTATLLGGITADAITLGDKKVTYSFTTPAKVSGVYNFSFPISLVSDVAETANTSAVFSYNVDFGTATGTFDLTSATAVGNVITVTYPVAVKGGAVANSATDLANYSLAGKALPAGTTITLDAAQKVATITLPANGVTTTDAAAIFTVANVKSLTGDTVKSYTGTVATTDNTQPVLNSAVLNTNGSITLGFSELLTTATVKGDYTIRLNGKVINDAQVTAITAGVGAEAGKFVIPNFVASFEDTDATPSNGDEKVYIDLDNSGTYSAANDILLQSGTFANIAGTNYATAVVGGKDAAITSITITTDAGATGKDLANNVIKAATTITVK